MLAKRLHATLGYLLRQPGLLLLLWAGGLLLMTSPSLSLMAQDEAYYAQQARWILQNNDWITVGWWGAPVFDRTIALQWLIALSYHWFGLTEWAVRVPSMVASLGAIGLTWQIGRRLVPSAAGAWGAAILTVMPLWMQASKLGMQDVLLVFLELLAIWALLQAEDLPRQRQGWCLLSGIALSLGFLVKSVMIVLPILALLPYLIRSQRRQGHLTNVGLYVGFGLGAIPTILWLGNSVARYGWLPLRQLFEKVLLLAQAGSAEATAFQSSTTKFYYLWHIPATTFPWMLFAALGGYLVWRNPQIGHRRWLFLGYPVVLFGLLSLFDTRTWYYTLQLYPFIALLAGVGLHRLMRLLLAERPRHYRVAVGMSWAIGVLAILLISAGVALLLSPGELIAPEIRTYGWLGTLGGLGWLLPWLIAINRGPVMHPPLARVWAFGWLLGPWLVVAAIFSTGLFGDYNPALKTALQTAPIAPVLENNSIHFIQPGGDRESILLTFYTPHLGHPYGTWQEVPTGQYAWGNGRLLPLPDERYTVIAEIDGWQLVKVPDRP
jgi:hypothetical protein